MLYLCGARVFTPHEEIPDAVVVLDGNRIAAVGAREQVSLPPSARCVELAGFTLAPGLIDLQLNGGLGDDFTSDPSTIWRVAAMLPQFGVTSFLPTIITSPLDTVRRARQVLEDGAPFGFRGARPLGLHLEGPFLNPARRGAHNPAYLRPPALDDIGDWSRERGVRLVTLAPELDGALDLVRVLTVRGVVVSAGHSLATYEQARAGFDAGITNGTHLFNAMPPIESRSPNLPTALLTDPRVTVGIIVDGVHVHPTLVALTLQAKGADRCCLVTDAMAGMGAPPGVYKLGDFQVRTDGISARLIGEADGDSLESSTGSSDGQLAGSVLTLDRAVRNLLESSRCSLSQALSAATYVPARVLGLHNERGVIAPGATADLAIFTPDLHPAATIAAGRVVWQNPNLIQLEEAYGSARRDS